MSIVVLEKKKKKERREKKKNSTKIAQLMNLRPNPFPTKIAVRSLKPPLPTFMSNQPIHF
jgi:hypothetical protein